jgi:hypothetical protein
MDAKAQCHGTDLATPWGDGGDRRRVRGDHRHGYLEVTLHASDAADAIAFLAYIASRFMDSGDVYVLTSDPIAHAVEFLISASANALPGSSPQLVLVLERLTLTPGSALSPREAGSLVWTTVEEGPQG